MSNNDFNMQDNMQDNKLAKLPLASLEDLATPSQARGPRQRDDILATTVQVRAPKNAAQWHSSTQANMFRVENLTAKVFEQVGNNSAMEQAAKKAVQEHARREREKQRVKVNAGVKAHQEFIGKTFKCLKEIEYAIVQIEGAQGRLVSERYARFASVKVCEHRMELRAKRPQPELFRDEVQRILEKEAEQLDAARKEILQQEADCKRILSELRRDWDDLAKDIGNRRLAMRYDSSTVNEGEDVDLYVSEEISDSKSDDIVVHALHLFEQALELNDFSVVLVKRIKVASEAIAKRVSLCLTFHTKDLSSMKSVLAKKIVEAEGAIDKAGVQLRHMEQRVEQGDQKMADVVKQMKNMLRELQASRQKTIEDLRCKTAALDIDNSCRKVTPQVASAPQGGPKKMGTSASAPSLVSPKNSTAGQGQTGQWKPTGGSGLPGDASSLYGNPQQGDVDHGRGAINFGHNRTGPSPTNAGGSNPLKAAAAASGLKL